MRDQQEGPDPDDRHGWHVPLDGARGDAKRGRLHAQGGRVLVRGGDVGDYGARAALQDSEAARDHLWRRDGAQKARRQCDPRELPPSV